MDRWILETVSLEAIPWSCNEFPGTVFGLFPSQGILPSTTT